MPKKYDLPTASTLLCAGEVMSGRQLLAIVERVSTTIVPLKPTLPAVGRYGSERQNLLFSCCEIGPQ